MKSNYKRLGDYIQQVDVRNVDDKRYELLGVSVEKCFISSIANTIGTDWHNYKIIKKGQFCYIPDTSRRGDKIGIAFLEDREIGLVSAVYTVFEVYNINDLMPEYLMLWFKRPEFDRYARYHSHGSVREIFDWEEMCNVELPVPSLDRQQKIVEAYKIIENRIALKRKINDNLELQAETVFNKKIIKNNLYPFNESLDKNINFINGLAMQNFRPKEGRKSYPVIKIRELTQGFCDNSSEYCHTDIGESHTVNKGDLVFSWSGSLQAAFWTSETCGLNQHLFKVVSYKYPKWLAYMWVKYHLLSFQRIAENKGTTFGHIKREDLHNAQIKSLDFSAIESYDKTFSPIVESIIANATELHFLMKLQRLVLSQLSR